MKEVRENERDGERKEASRSKGDGVSFVARFSSMAAVMMSVFFFFFFWTTTNHEPSPCCRRGLVPGAEGGGVEKRSEQKRVKLV